MNDLKFNLVAEKRNKSLLDNFQNYLRILLNFNLKLIKIDTDKYIERFC